LIEDYLKERRRRLEEFRWEDRLKIGWEFDKIEYEGIDMCKRVVVVQERKKEKKRDGRRGRVSVE
jgi:hypothetical protein